MKLTDREISIAIMVVGLALKNGLNIQDPNVVGEVVLVTAMYIKGMSEEVFSTFPTLPLMKKAFQQFNEDKTDETH